MASFISGFKTFIDDIYHLNFEMLLQCEENVIFILIMGCLARVYEHCTIFDCIKTMGRLYLAFLEKYRDLCLLNL